LGTPQTPPGAKPPGPPLNLMLVGMLRFKQVELHQQLAEGQARLARIEAWLQALEQEAMMPAYDVIVKRVPPLKEHFLLTRR